MLRHTERIEPVTFYTVYAESLQLFLVIDKAETITIGKTCHCRHVEGNITSYLLDLTNILAHRLWCIKRSDVRLSPIEEIVGKSSVECLFQVRLEAVHCTTK